MGTDGRLEQKAITSAMVDGEASPIEADDWLNRWSGDDATRSDWHLYHLIGDVMRSEDLAQSPVHDEAFLASLRARLNDQPVVLAPTALPESTAMPRPRRRLWAASAAAMAGFAVVAAGYFSTRIDPEGHSMLFVGAPSSTSARDSSLGGPADESLRRVSVAPAGAPTGVLHGAAPGMFREILRLPRGPASRPFDAMQILYSDGQATISVEVQAQRPEPPAGVGGLSGEAGERLNSLLVQRDGRWLTLTGPVPPAALEQFAAALPPLTTALPTSTPTPVPTPLSPSAR